MSKCQTAKNNNISFKNDTRQSNQLTDNSNTRKNSNNVISIQKETNPSSNIIEEVFFQYAGKEIELKKVIEQAKKDFISNSNKASDIKSLRLYVKPEEDAAYYIVNEDGNSKKIALK